MSQDRLDMKHVKVQSKTQQKVAKVGKTQQPKQLKNTSVLQSTANKTRRSFTIAGVKTGDGVRVKSLEPWCQISIVSGAAFYYIVAEVYDQNGSVGDLASDVRWFDRTADDGSNSRHSLLSIIPMSPAFFNSITGTDVNAFPLGRVVGQLSALFRKFKLHSAGLKWVSSTPSFGWFGDVKVAYEPTIRYSGTQFQQNAGMHQYFMNSQVTTQACSMTVSQNFPIPLEGKERFVNTLTSNAVTEDSQAEARQIFDGFALLNIGFTMPNSLPLGTRYPLGELFFEVDIEMTEFASSIVPVAPTLSLKSKEVDGDKERKSASGKREEPSGETDDFVDVSSAKSEEQRPAAAENRKVIATPTAKLMEQQPKTIRK